jgi:puromycin-sensitive aminopeptidase
VQRALLSTGRAELALEARRTPRWLYANAGESGFYRVAHDVDTLAGLVANVEPALEPAERVGLVSNQWALTRAGHFDLGAFLQFLDAFRAETHHSVVGVVVDALAFVDFYLVEPSQRPAFAALVERLLGGQLAELGWAPESGEGDGRDGRRLRRAAVIRALGRLARQPAAVAQARQGLERYWDDPSAVDPNLVDVFVAIAAQDGPPALFGQFLERMEQARTPQDEQRHLFGLAVFEDPALVQRALALSLTPTVKTQDVGPLLARLLGNPVGKQAAWEFVRAEWPALSDRLPPFPRRRLIAATAHLATPEARREVEAFFTAHPVEAAERTLQQTLEQLDLLIAFRARAQPRLREVLSAEC